MEKQTNQKENDLLFWVIFGAILIVGGGIIGYLLFIRSNNAQNSPPLIGEPTSAIIAEVTINETYTPEFIAATCDFAIPLQARVTCGFVSVPEDRDGDLNDTIQIAVAIYHSSSTSPQSDPIIYLQGGPGALAIDWSAGVYETTIVPLLDQRDFIVFDPRGVGYSKPRLDCDEIKSTYLSDIQGRLPAGEELSYYEGAVITCRNKLTNLGVNLPTYNSQNLAADAIDVVKALNYDQANFYGASYGTRIAQFVMRKNPEIVRSVILDSVVPVENQPVENNTNTEIERGMQLVFDDCKANLDCRSAYPDLESVYNETVSMLDAQPVESTLIIDNNVRLAQKLDGNWFRSTVVWGFRNPLTLSAIPQLIYRTHEGDYSILNYAAALPLVSFDTISTGTYISVNCHDQVFYVPTEGLNETIYELCELWGVTPLAPGENDPVSSDIPTLIFSGKYDTITPTTFADQLSSHLANSYVVEIPNQGHTPSLSGISDCPTKIILAFLDNPRNHPDLSCVEQTGEIDFIVPYNINNTIPLETIRIDQYNIDTLIPTNWTKAEFGFYNRNSLYGDITQIGIQRAAVSEAEWVIWLASNFQGSRGFDQPAVRVDQRFINGLSWKIYSARSQGFPVDIAFAKFGNETFMVLLYSYENEHDALYQAVFLPIVESVTSSQ